MVDREAQQALRAKRLRGRLFNCRGFTPSSTSVIVRVVRLFVRLGVRKGNIVLCGAAFCE
jgi:hypothetical protein